MNLYVASGLDNRQNASDLMRALEAVGHTITYDWTRHGPQPHRMAEVAALEEEGIRKADAVVVLLMGMRGTHYEMGYARGKDLPVVLVTGGHDLFCAFYHTPMVHHVPGGSAKETAGQICDVLRDLVEEGVL